MVQRRSEIRRIDMAVRALRLSVAAHDWCDRQRHAHGVSDISAFRTHRKGRQFADRRPRADLGICRWCRGKLVCAFIGARIGVVATVWLTEAVTAIGIVALLPLPLGAALVLLPVVGVALNGTSSVLYGSVPDLIEPARRQRAFSIFYTGRSARARYRRQSMVSSATPLASRQR